MQAFALLSHDLGEPSQQAHPSLFAHPTRPPKRAYDTRREARDDERQIETRLRETCASLCGFSTAGSESSEKIRRHGGCSASAHVEPQAWVWSWFLESGLGARRVWGIVG